jgi:hypothetical protein
MSDQTYIIPGGGIVEDLDFDASFFWNLCKHGIGLTVLMFLLIIGWAIVIGILVVLGSLIGLLIGFVILGLALGYLNSYLAEAVWKMGTDAKLVPRLFQGILLLIALLIADIPALAINFVLPHWLITVIVFIIYVPIHGFVGLKVAEVFETSMSYPEDGEYWEG